MFQGPGTSLRPFFSACVVPTIPGGEYGFLITGDLVFIKSGPSSSLQVFKLHLFHHLFFIG